MLQSAPRDILQPTTWTYGARYQGSATVLLERHKVCRELKLYVAIVAKLCYGMRPPDPVLTLLEASNLGEESIGGR